MLTSQPAQLERDSCREEIAGAQQAIAHLPGAALSLAYPFGSRSQETRQVALELGALSMLEVEGVIFRFDSYTNRPDQVELR